jgi:hypothetical protein
MDRRRRMASRGSMIIRIAIEVVIAILLLMVGNTFWEFPKRAKFLKKAISDQQFLLSFLTPVTFDSLSPAITQYAQCDGHYTASIGALAHADQVSQRRSKFITGAIVLALLVGSYFVGPIYLAISIAVFLLSGLGRIGSAARKNALDHILALG